MKIKYTTNSEAKDILHSIKEDSPLESQEYEYVRQFSKLDKKDAVAAVNKIKEISDFNEEVCVKLVDILPENTEQILAIMNSYKLTPSDEVLSSIIDYLKGLQ
jgi:DNA-directed RNA polymerase subunit F